MQIVVIVIVVVLVLLGGAAMFAGFLVAMAVASQLGQFHEIFADDTEPLGLLLAAAVVLAGLLLFVLGAALAEVFPVESGSRTLKDAINEALRDWVTNVDTTYYLLGSALGPHPYPLMVRDFQSCIGREARERRVRGVRRSSDRARVPMTGVDA